MNIRQLSWLALFTLLSVVFSLQAIAQDDEEEKKPPAKPPALLAYDQEVLVTAERSPEGIQDSTRSVSVVTRQEINERLSRTVPEALRYEEGILVQRTNLGGGSPFIRGLTGNQVLYQIDGIRLNNSTFRSGPNQYLNTIDPFFIDRIEIVRGPSSVLYGSDALGGTINIVTHRRNDYTKPYGSSGRWLGRATTADNEQTGHWDFDFNATPHFGMAFSGNFRKFGDVEPGSGLPLQRPYGYEEQDFAGNFDFPINDHFLIQASAQFVNLDEVDNFDPSSIENVFEPQRRQLYYAKLHVLDASEFLDRIVLFASYQEQMEGREQVRFDSADQETRDLDIVDTLGTGLQFESPIGNWVRFIYGGEYYRDSINSHREVENFNTDNVMETDARFPDDSTYTSYAGYLEVRVTPTEWLKMVPGVRYSAYTPNLELEDPATGTIKVDDTIDDITWAFHTLFSFADYHGVAAGVSRGFRAPGIDDLAKLGSEDGRLDVPNPDLDPESMIQYEVGYRITHPNVYLSWFGYYSTIDDLIVRKPAEYNGQTTIGTDTVNQNRNVGEAVLYGTEFAARFVFLDEFLQAGGTIAYTFGHNETDDEPLRRIPPITGSAYARLTFEPVWAEWALEASGKQDRLSQADKDDVRIGPDGTEGFDIHHLRVGINAASWVQAVLAVENITDEKYKYHGSGIYEAGRNYKMQLSFLF